MFKPSTRARSFTSVRPCPAPDFAETQFQHGEDEDDYAGFAPTQMFEDSDPAPVRVERRAVRREGGSGAHLPAEEAAMPASWITSRWVEAQEAKAHQAADQARALISAQRRQESPPRAMPSAAAPERAAAAGWIPRLRRTVRRLLPIDITSVLPLFICVSLTMALISAVLPMLDKP